VDQFADGPFEQRAAACHVKARRMLVASCT
jgi:hypothetical protein